MSTTIWCCSGSLRFKLGKSLGKKTVLQKTLLCFCRVMGEASWWTWSIWLLFKMNSRNTEAQFGAGQKVNLSWSNITAVWCYARDVRRQYDLAMLLGETKHSTSTTECMSGAHTDVPALLATEPAQASLVENTAALDTGDRFMGLSIVTILLPFLICIFNGCSSIMFTAGTSKTLDLFI